MHPVIEAKSSIGPNNPPIPIKFVHNILNHLKELDLFVESEILLPELFIE